MPFDPYAIHPLTIPEEVVPSENVVILTAHGEQDDEKWSISLSDPTLQLPVYGTLRVDPSMSRDQVVEIVRSWITSECEARGFMVVSFEDEGNLFEDPQYADTSLLVKFCLQRA